MKILVVDDVKFSCIYMQRVFENAGHTVLTALDAQGGLDVLKDNPDITIIFTDLIMPEIDGIQFFQEAQKLSVFNNGLGGMSLPPFVLLTACTDNKKLEEASYVGFRQIVQKPVNGEQLLLILESITQIAVNEKKLNLLIVDAEGSTKQWMETMFDGTQHTLMHAESTEEALNLSLGATIPSIIICESDLNDDSGLGLFKALKKEEQKAFSEEKAVNKIPFLLLTNTIEPEDLKACRKVGLKDIMTKPLDLALMASKISKMVSPDSDKKKKETKPEVLIVDDVGYNLIITKKALEQNGYQVNAVKSSFEALDILKDNALIKLVISDLIMPEMDGIELLRNAKKIRKTIPPFILITASNDEIQISEAQKLGYKSILRKPSSIEDIGRAVTEVLNPTPEPSAQPASSSEETSPESAGKIEANDAAFTEAPIEADTTLSNSASVAS